MDDLISRQDVIDYVLEQGFYCDTEADKEYTAELIRTVFPSAQQWIPCSERLPEENGDYIVTDDSGGAIWVGATFFIWDDEGKPNWGLANVTAWMPLPEPYMEDINDG